MRTNEHTIDCTGDAVVGDEICFERATYVGKYPNSRFASMETIIGKIVNDSYGAAKQQHTFTILLDDGTKICVKGRNVYRNGVHRKPWANETERGAALDEKHGRGDRARKARDVRRELEGYHQ
jgi:hypothetical protein